MSILLFLCRLFIVLVIIIRSNYKILVIEIRVCIICEFGVVRVVLGFGFRDVRVFMLVVLV